MGALISKLDAINADPQFQSVFTMAHIHGTPYTGPNWVDEVDNARAAIAKAKAGA